MKVPTMLSLLRSFFSFFVKKGYSMKNSSKIWHESALSIFRESKNVTIGKYSIVDNNSKIGRYTYIGRGAKVTKTNIGNYCSIGDSVTIGPGEHDITNSTLHEVGYSSAYDELTKSKCSIGHDVWIGADAIIMRGVEIGNGAVVGANSVVTKDVKPYSVVVGVPAKEIKKRIDEATIILLEKEKWWEKDYSEARKLHESINSQRKVSS